MESTHTSLLKSNLKNIQKMEENILFKNNENQIEDKLKKFVKRRTFSESKNLEYLKKCFNVEHLRPKTR